MSLRGVGASQGVGHGPVFVLTAEVPEPPEGATYTGDADQEKARARAALDEVAGVLEGRGRQAGGAAEDVLNAQAMMARDPGLLVGVEALIDHGTAAERAVYEAFGRYRSMLVGTGGYMGERAADLDDVRDRTVALLTGHPMHGVPLDAPEPFVLVARDLAPADTALLSKEVVTAFVTERGGPTSHTAILARAMGVPAVVACAGATSLAPGTLVLVDGSTGEVRVGPTDAEVAGATGAEAARQEKLAAVRGPGRTADGHSVPLLANVGGPGDLDAALAHGAEGVGLFRTEFLFLGRKAAPTQDEQVAAYRPVLEAFPGATVVVRTLDAGADKPLAFLPAREREPNPALGERGLRMSRRFPEVLADQLAALERAVAGTAARLHVMAPMVATAEEAAWFTEACRTAGLAAAGVMIEIPAAAIRARDLAEHVDFFSIGTNDLAQYLFAADREMAELSALHDAWQPALLDLVAAAAGAGRPCGVCGEAAADPALACVLVGLGATALSMSASALPAVRAALAGHTTEQCRLAAAAARSAKDAATARQAARAHLPGLADLAL
ncbi:phosphoenolpyruvate--protein phosphotransferase [Nonomuraea sp. NPDC046570]|uniref:phosphoenolpyruvate--protein phosphotransferase n=1 Tax=Nonomuraea sp. NPDC046570 TaxID=3155255 RepID=UPI0034117777